MTARSTGVFPREGINLDAQMQVPENAGGTVALLGDLSKAKTIRVIFHGVVITGNGSITLNMITTDSAYRTYTAADVQDGMIIDHLRGAATAAGCYIELVDGPRR
jgi:hypothetical protein